MQQEKQKAEEICKEAKRVTIGWKRDTIWDDQNMLSTLKKTCHDGQFVTRFEETLISAFCYVKETCHDLLKTWHDFGRNYVPI